MKTQRLHSFIPVDADSHFPVQNLPYGVFVPDGVNSPRIGVAIGAYVLDLSVVQQARLLPDSLPPQIFAQSSLNGFMALGRAAWKATRTAVQTLLLADNPRLRDDAALRQRALLPQTAVTMRLPAKIGDYTDFYSSKEHASNVGTMFGRKIPLLPNWLRLPVGYHGRSSSIVVSGAPIRRPQGQIMEAGADAPIVAPTRELDFELEMGFFIGPGNEMGAPIDAAETMEHIFGMVLVNDWSARDIQRWEYRPLGPFLAKNFATSISPWVVTMEALEPFRCAGPAQDPAPLSYLQTAGDNAYDIRLEVLLKGEDMEKAAVISRSNFRHLYWNMRQQLAHHTITGCNARPGDLLASGTISGPTTDSCGSMLELSWKGQRPLTLPNGATRTFLQDGDELTLTGYCQGDGYCVGFGETTGRILPLSTH